MDDKKKATDVSSPPNRCAHVNGQLVEPNGTIVPVVEALAIVVQHLKDAKIPAGDRGYAGTFTDTGVAQIMEAGQLQQLVKDSAMAGTDRLPTAKDVSVTVVDLLNSKKFGVMDYVKSQELDKSTTGRNDTEVVKTTALTTPRVDLDASLNIETGDAGCDDVLPGDTTGGKQQQGALFNQRCCTGKVAVLQTMQSSRSGMVDAIEIGQLSKDQQKSVSKLPRDIPAATALARIYQAIGSSLENRNMSINVTGEDCGAAECSNLNATVALKAAGDRAAAAVAKLTFDRATNAKNHATVVVVGHVEKAGIETTTVCSMLEATGVEEKPTEATCAEEQGHTNVKHVPDAIAEHAELEQKTIRFYSYC